MNLPDPRHFKNIVVLTGAGVSAESGLRTFRDNNGLWREYRVEELATPEAFAKNPKLVHAFYNSRRHTLLQSAKANKAHFALANFESTFQGNFLLVTQNVDNLHEQAGSKNPHHLHGELLRARCGLCQHSVDIEGDLTCQSICRHCGGIGAMRPDIVWFGEMPQQLELIEPALSRCDLFVSIGTSGTVYPAAGFLRLAKTNGAITVELNLEASANSDFFDYCSLGLATDVLPNFFRTA